VGGLLFLCAYLFVVTSRIQYPFELEKMEGGIVDHVSRILTGNKLYIVPSLEFVPYAYTPLYVYLSAWVAQFIGIGFVAPRLVSVIASLACFCIIFLIVEKETKNNFAAFASCCLFAATFRASGAWLDLARVDSLFLGFILVAIYLIRLCSSWGACTVAGLCISLSFLTKQTALVIVLPILLFCIATTSRRGVLLSGIVAAVIGLSTISLNYIHDGWYSYYVFQLQSRPPIAISRVFSFWTEDLFSVLPIAIVIALYYVLMWFRYPSETKRLFYCSVGIGFVGGSYLSRLSYVQYDNVLLPAYAIISIMFGLGIHQCRESMATVSINTRAIVQLCLYVAIAIQYLALVYNPLVLIPTREDVYAGKQLIDRLRSIPGDVLVAHHGYLSTLAGKNIQAQGVAVSDVMSRDIGHDKKLNLINQTRTAIREKRFAAIIVDTWWWFQDDIDKYYRLAGNVFERADVFYPVSGARTRPELIYVPKD
jgi:4-amino-4-deoxy-L-arabinose transferase-like glycosyltransferase